MRKKSGITMGIVITCMAAIIIFGRIILGPFDSQTAVAEIYDENNTIKGDKPDSSHKDMTLAAQDTYQEDMAGQAEDKQTIAVQPEDKKKEGIRLDQKAQQLAIREEKARKKQLHQEQMEQARKKIDVKNPSIEVSAKAAALYDPVHGRFIYTKNALDKIQPASTAKLLTAITAIELGGSKQKFKVGSEIQLIASDSSRAYLVKGQVLSLDQILDALLLPSGNDAAYVIAANMGRKIADAPKLKDKQAVKRFVEAMNKKAEEIGVVHSNFVTPDGYDAEKQYTTAYDMALIGAKALDYEEILETVKKPRARDILLSGEDVTWTNSNRLIKKGSGYYYSYAIGLKTGTSGEAGRCLVSAAEKKGRKYVSVVMDASMEGRWQDSVNLLRYGIGKK